METWRSRTVVNDDSIHVLYDVVSSGKLISAFPRTFQEDVNLQCAVFLTLNVSDAKAEILNPK
jgi:soluble P-type ATPase